MFSPESLSHALSCFPWKLENETKKKKSYTNAAKFVRILFISSSPRFSTSAKKNNYCIINNLMISWDGRHITFFIRSFAEHSKLFVTWLVIKMLLLLLQRWKNRNVNRTFRDVKTISYLIQSAFEMTSKQKLHTLQLYEWTNTDSLCSFIVNTDRDEKKSNNTE